MRTLIWGATWVDRVGTRASAPMRAYRLCLEPWPDVGRSGMLGMGPRTGQGSPRRGPSSKGSFGCGPQHPERVRADQLFKRRHPRPGCAWARHLRRRRCGVRRDLGRALLRAPASSRRATCLVFVLSLWPWRVGCACPAFGRRRSEGSTTDGGWRPPTRLRTRSGSSHASVSATGRLDAPGLLPVPMPTTVRRALDWREHQVAAGDGPTLPSRGRGQLPGRSHRRRGPGAGSSSS